MEAGSILIIIEDSNGLICPYCCGVEAANTAVLKNKSFKRRYITMVRMPDDMVDRTPYQNILYEKDPEDNRLVSITLNQPERMNALS